MPSSPHSSPEPSAPDAAARHWHAEIEPTRRGRPRVVARWLVDVALGFLHLGGTGEWPGYDVVVRERATGREVHRVPRQTLADADHDLQGVRADLRRLDRDAYRAERGL